MPVDACSSTPRGRHATLSRARRSLRESSKIVGTAQNMVALAALASNAVDNTSIQRNIGEAPGLLRGLTIVSVEEAAGTAGLLPPAGVMPVASCRRTSRAGG